ncbi:beta-hydroxyacyl-ACP dehydratase [Chlamydia muridarum str. Nigg]|jgi:beta-hydroxyacyl-[acyl carrier protein] dehydratase FabZ|uniref:3-hydroxyacyl-[acyl-carrier-protein] dehydratase FabZ n=2 Tax=Chlamydia muridarum TaxID=83560 RepID=FABZ_CHLMU|nr:3-hydroxyacyl-ACP dehydratase FabZ [Chlamydia muridarum]Q9PJL0.1 RecName: Full=3-hydroxyacyl-[acyl-carrier-protein] dehydratase FabZ; AltName: Full=(3R)-hydroxymyristoyl-[acyl-carrier-protein] dehydratase; Short=(3R)-hydroxymyristoyl-ACP dehydrase; AltName: Full=Beta-hydroxyacyl-ACP dehydratase [Chlamydia muridarum str. Nigg]UFX24821.1 3-hydroxyacyl-ACP dehydratase FabZ [Chlamydia trachomatis]AAF39621.1 (3R)-hydroxymyristol-(acyl carrier protein) dehydratase [Chlamydia muridarum str. Nigg]AH
MSEKPVLGIQDIQNLLPHRYPFLLVDKILSYDLNTRSIVAQKNVTINEPFFVGHFPEAPIMPGVLILEALAQAAGVLLGIILENDRDKKIALFLGIQKAKFRQPVKPGDVLILKAEFSLISAKGGKAIAQAFVGSQIVAEGELSFVLVKKESI